MKIFSMWRATNLTNEQQAVVDRQQQDLEAAMAPVADGLSLGQEDGIPTVTVWLDDERIMTFAVAALIATKMYAVFECAVHFHEMRSHAITFFVFNGQLGKKFSEAQVAEYGTPLEKWLPSVTGQHVEPITL